MDLKLPKRTLICPGGADINPALYNKNPHRTTYYYNMTDSYQLENYYHAIEQGFPIFGICRGQQLIASQNGLELCQDIRHPSQHGVFIKEDGTFSRSVLVNSLHHQLVYTRNKLKGETFEVLGHCSLSPHHHGEVDNEYQGCTIEPEIMYFPKVNALSTQFHPEMMSRRGIYEPVMEYLQKQINEKFKHFFQEEKQFFATKYNV